MSFPVSSVSSLGLLPDLPICDLIRPVPLSGGFAAVAGQCAVVQQLLEFSLVLAPHLPLSALLQFPNYSLSTSKSANQSILPAHPEMLPALLVMGIPPGAVKPGRAPDLHRFLFTPQPGAMSLFVQESSSWDTPVLLSRS